MWTRKDAFAVMSPQMTTTNSTTLLKYTQLSGHHRSNVANGGGLVGRCMLGELHTVIFRHVATIHPQEFLRLKEAQDCSIRSLCFVKLSHDSVAELVNMDEKLAQNMAAILPRIAKYVCTMHSELPDPHDSWHEFGESLWELSPAASVSSDSTALSLRQLLEGLDLDLRDGIRVPQAGSLRGAWYNAILPGALDDRRRLHNQAAGGGPSPALSPSTHTTTDMNSLARCEKHDLKNGPL